MDNGTLLPQVANYGFPMVLSWYLLVRMEGRLDRLTDSINSLARSIAAGKQHKKTQLRLRLFILYHCLPSVDTAPVSQRIGSVAVRTDRAAKEHQVDGKEKADQRNEGQQYHERAVVKVMQTSDVQRQAAERGDKGQSKGQYLEHRSVWRKQTANQIA